MAIDLFCGLGGWSEGLIAEGYDVTGYDIEAHEYGDQKYPGTLVLLDVLTIHGSEFKDAALIVASPPCQAYSYMAMPFSRGKKIAAEYRDGTRSIDDLNALFNACFRIQREACEAAGRYIPMVVENVKGAQPWVGKAKAHYGSFYLWGDVDMVGDRIYAGGLKFGDSVRVRKSVKGFGGTWFHNAELGTTNPNRSRTTEDSGVKCGGSSGDDWFAHHNRDSFFDDGRKVPGMNFHDFEKTGKPGRSFQSAAVAEIGRDDGTKQGGNWWHDPQSITRKHSSKSPGRKAASAQIAKIPFPLSSYIARVFKPEAIECRKCGFKFDARCGIFGCPNCHGEGLT